MAFIGESPGHQEKIKRTPFVGPSGKLLRQITDEQGIDVDGSLLTNAALCNYRDSDKDSLPSAIDACRPRLLAELEEAGIWTAVTLGNSAVRSLLNTKTGITKLRGGEARSSDYAESVLVVPTFHPAAVLRNQGQYPLLLADIGKVLPTPEPTYVEPTIIEITDTTRAERFLDNAYRKGTTAPLVVDVETGTEKEEGYNRTTNLLCVGMGSTSSRHGNKVFVIGRPAIYGDSVRSKLMRLLRRNTIICQNGKFDVYILSRLMNKSERATDPIWLHADTMLMSYSLNENPGTHSLGYMGVEYLGTPHWKDEIKQYLIVHKYPKDQIESARQFLLNSLPHSDGEILPDAPFRSDILKSYDGPGSNTRVVEYCANEMRVSEFKVEGQKYANRIRWALPSSEDAPVLSPSDADGSYAAIPPALLHLYNGRDVQVTRQLYSRFVEEQGKEGLTELNAHLMVMANALMRVEAEGLVLDFDYNQKLYNEFTEYLAELDVFSFNPGSWQQLRKYIKNTFDVEMASTDEDHMVMLRDHPRSTEEIKTFCRQLLEFRRWTKLRSTYVTSIRKLGTDNGGVVLPTFKIDQATTGRLASKNPNVQNIPRKFNIKRQFVPSRSDRVFVHADYSQLELRVLTWLAKDKRLRDLFNDPTRDIFDELMMPVYNMTEDDVVTLKSSDYEEAKERRVIVKSFAYGIAYGRTPEGIAADPDLSLTVEEARDRHAVFQEQIPDILAFQRKVVRDIHKGKDLVNVFGRRRRFHLITHQNRHDLEKQAMAFLPQSTASDICVTALSRLPRWMDPRNIIHDDILLEAPRADVKLHGDTLARIMKETAEEFTDGYVDFEADAEYGENWGEMMSYEKWIAKTGS